MAINIKWDRKRVFRQLFNSFPIFIIFLLISSFINRPGAALSLNNIARNLHVVILIYIILFIITCIFKESIKISRRATLRSNS